MNPKIKNIIIFSVIAAVLILAYLLFLRGDPEEENLVSSFPESSTPVAGMSSPDETTMIAGDFLTTLLNVRNIKLDDSIFSDTAFLTLRDSSISLIPDGNEGRPNPFAPIGVESPVPASSTTPPSAFPAPTNP